MEQSVSNKLDALRFCAALAVVASHTSYLGYTGFGSGIFRATGRMGVVAFFVLSGYVIAYVCEHKHALWRDYLVARLARLQSVFLPAMLLTWCADVVGRALAPTIYQTYPSPWDLGFLASTPLFIAFLHESFEQSLRWLSNGPLWSIAYEFWYYILYGAYFFLRGMRRWLVLSLAVAASGFKILLLFPIWLAGVVLYRNRSTIAALAPRAVKLFSILGMVAVIALCLPNPPGPRSIADLEQLGRSLFGDNNTAYVFWDLALVPFMCLIMFGITHPSAATPSEHFSRWIKPLANGTYSIYSYHLPLLLLARAAGAYDITSPTQAVLAAIGVVAVCLTLSMFTERRKHPWVKMWRRILAVKRATPYAQDTTV